MIQRIRIEADGRSPEDAQRQINTAFKKVTAGNDEDDFYIGPIEDEVTEEVYEFVPGAGGVVRYRGRRVVRFHHRSPHNNAA